MHLRGTFGSKVPTDGVCGKWRSQIRWNPIALSHKIEAQRNGAHAGNTKYLWRGNSYLHASVFGPLLSFGGLIVLDRRWIPSGKVSSAPLCANRRTWELRPRSCASVDGGDRFVDAALVASEQCAIGLCECDLLPATSDRYSLQKRRFDDLPCRETIPSPPSRRSNFRISGAVGFAREQFLARLLQSRQDFSLEFLVFDCAGKHHSADVLRHQCPGVLGGGGQALYFS